MDEEFFDWTKIREINPRYLEFQYPNPIKINSNITDCLKIIGLLEEPANKNPGPSKIFQIVTKNLEELDKLTKKSSHLSTKQGTKRSRIANCDDNPIKNVTLNEISKPGPLKPKEIRNFWIKSAFQVLYGRHKPYKKNKEWSFDGFLSVKPEGITLFHCSGSVVARIERNLEKIPKVFSSGTELVLGQWECQISDEISIEEFETGAYFAPE